MFMVLGIFNLVENEFFSTLFPDLTACFSLKFETGYGFQHQGWYFGNEQPNKKIRFLCVLLFCRDIVGG
jgi:hypothetical protein